MARALQSCCCRRLHEAAAVALAAAAACSAEGAAIMHEAMQDAAVPCCACSCCCRGRALGARPLLLCCSVARCTPFLRRPARTQPVLARLMISDMPSHSGHHAQQQRRRQPLRSATQSNAPPDAHAPPAGSMLLRLPACGCRLLCGPASHQDVSDSVGVIISDAAWPVLQAPCAADQFCDCVSSAPRRAVPAPAPAAPQTHRCSSSVLLRLRHDSQTLHTSCGTLPHGLPRSGCGGACGRGGGRASRSLFIAPARPHTPPAPVPRPRVCPDCLAC